MSHNLHLPQKIHSILKVVNKKQVTSEEHFNQYMHYITYSLYFYLVIFTICRKQICQENMLIRLCNVIFERCTGVETILSLIGWSTNCLVDFIWVMIHLK